MKKSLLSRRIFHFAFLQLLLLLRLTTSHPGAQELLDLGHSNRIVDLQISGDRLLSLDDRGQWRLWSLSSGEAVAEGMALGKAIPPGENAVRAQLGGGYFLISDGFRSSLRDTDIGAERESYHPGMQLAKDGSCVWQSWTDSLIVRKTQGAKILHLQGPQSKNRYFIDFSGILVAESELGRVTRYSMVDGAKVGEFSFAGLFHSWFLDGSGFLTTHGSVVRAYSSTGKLETLIDVPGFSRLKGSGRHFWLFQDGEKFFKVFDLDRDEGPARILGPLAHVDGMAESGRAVAIRMQDTTLFLDLTSADLSIDTSRFVVGSQTICVAPSGDWFIGSREGVVYRGRLGEPTLRPAPMNAGNIRAYATSSDLFAVSTSISKVYIFDRRGDAAGLVKTLELDATWLAMTSDGRYLAYLVRKDDKEIDGLYVLDLVDSALVGKWFFSDRHGPFLSDFRLSPDGRYISFNSSNMGSSARTASVRRVLDNSVFLELTSTSNRAPIFGQAGRLLVVDETITKVYEEKRLINSVGCVGVGWISDTAFLVSRLGPNRTSHTVVFDLGGDLVPGYGRIESRIDAFSLLPQDRILSFAGSSVIDLRTGYLVGKIPDALAIRPVGADHMLVNSGNRLTFEKAPQNWEPVSLRRTPPSVRTEVKALRNGSGGWILQVALDTPAPVSLDLFDATGVRIAGFQAGSRSTRHEFRWKGAFQTSQAPARLFYRLRVGPTIRSGILLPGV